MHIVKFGGSLYHQPALLSAWLQKLSDQARDEAIVLVPGGGPFADLIRDAQRHFKLADAQAHELAIDAMGQFGRLLMALNEQAQPFVTLTQTLPATGLFIWHPDSQALNQTSLAKDWTVTSDTIALWLAQQYHCSLTLLKSTPQRHHSLRLLTREQHIDAAFRDRYLAAPVPLRLLSAQRLSESDNQDWTLFDD